MRVFSPLLVVAASLVSLPAIAQNFEVLTGQARLTRQGQTYRVERGAKFYEGDILTVDSQVQFLGDFGAFVATQQNGQLQATLLRRESGCIRNLITYLGRLTLVVRPRTCNRSFLQVQSIKTGASYTFWGTQATVSDNSTSSLIAVDHGAVESSNLGKSVMVPGGFGNITSEGKPPGEAIALDQAFTLESLKIRRTTTGIKVFAKSNPLNRIYVQGVELRNNPASLEFPISGNSLRIEVSNLAGDRTRIFSFPLPRRKS
jgi:hypothetical protein